MKLSDCRRTVVGQHCHQLSYCQRLSDQTRAPHTSGEPLTATLGAAALRESVGTDGLSTWAVVVHVVCS